MSLIKIITAFILVIPIFACGDYKNSNIELKTLSSNEIKDVYIVAVMNIYCAGLNRYTNDLRAPIESESYLENAKTAWILFSNHKFIEKEKEIKDYSLKLIEEDFENFKKKMYSSIIKDLNDNKYSVDELFSMINSSDFKRENLPSINNCHDVRSITRMVLDPILVL